MALGDSYATLAEIRSRLGITDVSDTADDDRITSALLTASRGIDTVCQRQFNDAGSASARLFYPDGGLLEVDDFSTTTGLVVAVDSGDAGTYATTWSPSDYQLEPLNGVVGGEAGWPYWRIRAVGRSFPRGGVRAPVRVTARWGWSAVPEPVKEATRVVAVETFKLKDAAYGVAGYGDFGPIRVRANPMAMAMIAQYRRDPVLVA